MKRLLFALLLVTAFLTSCANAIEPIENVKQSETLQTSITPETTLPPVTSIKEIPVEVPEIEEQEFSKKLEAENANIAGDLKIAGERAGFSGKGYVTGFTKNISNRFSLKLNIESSQHYDITVYAASDSKRTNSLLINGADIGKIFTSGSGEFEKITFKGVFLEKGETEVSVREDEGWLDIDYILIKNNSEIRGITSCVDTDLINQNSDEKAKNVMQYLADNYQKRTISGQYVSSQNNDEMDLIYQTTGKYPAMLLADFENCFLDGEIDDNKIESAIKWGEQGGLVSLMWHWKAPMNEPFYYADETKFDLSRAVTKIDVATLSMDELQKLYDGGKINNETLAVIKDIDMISGELKKFKDAGVTVLWRPLHEASGGWFWWGSKGADNYKWLWKLLVDRQIKYHSLNNIIWVWNGQSDTWYVGDNYCDIVSADIYTKSEDYSSHVNEFISLNNLVKGKKMLAVSECGTIPNPFNVKRDNSVWSFFGLWYGQYLMNEFGEFNSEYTSKEQLVETYNSEGVITLDDLPDFVEYSKKTSDN